MKDWFCPYQFSKRLADESAKCPYRSAEKKDGAILYGNFGDAYSFTDKTDILDLPRAGFSWQEVFCYACSASEGQCAIQRKCIEESFGSLVNYEKWKKDRELREVELAELEAKKKAELNSREVRIGKNLLTVGDTTYELDAELRELFMSTIVGAVPESDFCVALQYAKVVS